MRATAVRWVALSILTAAIAAAPVAGGADPPTGKDTGALPPPVELTAQQDHQRIMDLLHIAALRPGADPNHREAANAVNYDESKATPYPKLPDPLRLKNGRRVTTARTWWSRQ